MHEFSLMQLTVKAADFFAGEFDRASSHGIETVIIAAANIFARMPFGAALFDDNIADFGYLTAKKLDTQSFGLRITPQRCTAPGFFMSHMCSIFKF